MILNIDLRSLVQWIQEDNKYSSSGITFEKITISFLGYVKIKVTTTMIYMKNSFDGVLLFVLIVSFSKKWNELLFSFGKIC